MCGIVGVLKRKNAFDLVKKGLCLIKYRGLDGFGIYGAKIQKVGSIASLKRDSSDIIIGHCLHSVVNHVPQPFKGKGVFFANCEIYNWEALSKRFRLNARNDAEAFFLMLESKEISEVLDCVDGVYAFSYLLNNKIYLARDILGVKPLWYSHSDGFAFASEKKALEKMGYFDIIELNPRKILVYNLSNDSVAFVERDFFRTTPETSSSLDEIERKLELLITEAVRKRIPSKKFGVLFSGGIDSTVIAKTCKKLGADFTCYTAVLDDPALKIPEDLVYSKKVAKKLGLKLKIIRIKLSDIDSILKKVVPLIEDTNVVKVGVALTFFAACKKASEDGCKVIFSGLGAEELFAGYQRHKNSLELNKECVSGLLKIYERDTYRDDVITMANNLELRVPFLDNDLVSFSLKIPAQFKLKDNCEKWVLRRVAQRIGIPEELCFRKKRAAQYGSNFHKALQKLTRKAKLKYISEYLLRFYPTHNVPLGALISSGKDSLYAMYVMMRQNYKINCLITIKSKAQDSFMFHTPTVDLVKLQAEAMGLPLIEKDTTGEKESELKDLKKALSMAKNQFGIEGVVNGALFSNYQRERIERVCDSLNLKIFSPLWHLNQESEMREILREGFEFVFSSVAADGLDKSWINKIITHTDVDKLVRLNAKNSINVSGEGGEFETLVLNAPMFKKRIRIEDFEIEEDGPNVARLVVKKASLQ
ncbi:diphthine--ammonia ligase [Candidatus Woesearchaeota archaeon]|nr:MAG: diphthine--ammonia ligase [Candidatus Woesearchaeota archaeon]